MKIICPLGFDLKRDADGIQIGDGTKLSCDRAIQLVSQDLQNTIIVATAGNAGSKWHGIVMSKVMAKYIRDSAPRINIVEDCADSFNTFGEMKALAKIASRMHGEEIILAVKDWHASRARLLLKFWLWKYGCDYIVSVSTYPQPVPIRILFQEYFGSWPKNLLKVVYNLFRKIN